MRAWIETVRHAGPEPVILAGVGGGLSESASAGTAWIASRVVDAMTGAEWVSPLSDPRATAVVVVCAAGIVSQRAERTALAQRCAGDVVDLESAALARWATAEGRDWAVVRGVSDDLRSTLPPGVGTWIGPRGAVRPLRIAADLLRRPRGVGEVARLRRAGALAMARVASLIEDVLRRAAPDRT
jgi:rhodanese-related sulfurtransferase